ncbi:sulfotransferase family protein [Litorilituus sediminis]|uniref:sulfotransferase family protein n=1 Tax=Litorilituus sediminis TaxID=718192 RepID=UPI00248295D7|nr:sulfotransferase family protein [Litorilituus sediminis]
MSIEPTSSGKVFIIGLPRTSTTSICLAMLELGYKTAHTAFTQKAFAQSDAMADTPIFCDYQLLDKTYPNSKFIYLVRDAELWLPSIKQLLQRMYTNLQRTDGGFNPIMKRCYNEVFSPLTQENIADDAFLLSCYEKHLQTAQAYFNGRESDLLTINISHKDSFAKLLSFLNKDKTCTEQSDFYKINIAGKVRAWQGIKHPLKVESTQNGKVDSKLFYL